MQLRIAATGAVVALTTLLACEPSPPGATGPMGDDLESRVAALEEVVDELESGGSHSYRWYDAEGTYVTSDPLLYYVDDDGVFWDLYYETATLDGRGYHHLIYESQNCSGDAYVLSMVPGTAFYLQGEPEYYVRPDTLKSVEICGGSFLETDTGLCTQSSVYCPNDVLLLEDCIPEEPIEKPDNDWVAPFHRALPY